MAAQLQAALTILRRRQVEQRTGLPRSTIYGKLKFNPKRPNEFDASFPRPIRLGPGARAVGFLESEIDAWLNAQVVLAPATTTATKRGKTKTAG